MAKPLYGERDYSFGQRMFTLRNALGLTQSGLAELLGVSRRAVAEWEAGSSYPKAEHLKHFILLGLQQHVFSLDNQAEEVRALWKAARQKVLLDEQWLSATLEQVHVPPPCGPPTPVKENVIDRPMKAQAPPGIRVDWGDALAVSAFYGRRKELEILSHLVLQEHCRVISVLGMGGIGKSALAINVMRQLAEQFDAVIFRSLRNAPSCDMLLEECFQTLSPQLRRTMPAGLEQRVGLLLEQLRKTRTLIVLDNLEVLLEEGNIKGQLRPGFEAYGHLLRRVAETEHQSCLLLTSREKLAELRPLEGKHSPVRSLRLTGLDVAACERLFAEKGVVGSAQEQAHLAKAYAGNPLALRIVAETISDLFGGEIRQFLAEGMMIFGNIADLLAEQFARLSHLEQVVLRWLAIAREPVTIEELLTMLVTPLLRVQLFEAIDSLRRRSLVERGQRQASFTLQSVVLEYVTEVLLEEIADEIQQQRLDHLIEYELVQAGAKEYVRQAQKRLLVTPLLVRLQGVYQGSSNIENHLLLLLKLLRKRTDYTQGYGPANIIALLRELRGNLNGIDLSCLTIRGACLQGVDMQDASLAGATLCDTIFTEALDATWSVAVSCTGRYWAAGSRSGKVRVWCDGGRRLHLAWKAHTDNTFTLAFSPDERTLATGSWDGTVKLWDLEHGTLFWTGRHTDLVRRVAFAPDGQTLASGGGDAAVRLWEVRSGRNIQTLTDPGGAVYSVAWSSDGRLLASSSFDNSIRLWQVQDSQSASCIQILRGHTNWIFSLAFSPDSTHLASGSWDDTVRLWDLQNEGACQILSGHTDRVHDMAWSPDGRTVASAGFDKTIWLWDVEQNYYRATLHGHTAVVYSLAFTSDSGNLLSSSEDGTVRVWDVASGECLRIIEGYAVSFYAIDWSPDGTQLASVGTDMLVTLWDVASGTRFRELRGHSWTVFGVAWSPAGRLLASSGRDNAIRLWEPTTGTCLQVLRDPDYDDTLFYGIAWSPDGRLLACGSYTRGIQVWDMETRTRLWVGLTHRTRMRDVAWSRDGTQLASCGDDGSACLWRASDGLLLKKFQGYGGIMSIAWSPDGTRLASGGAGKDGGEVLVWDVQSGKLIQILAGHAGSVFSVAWSLNQEILVSGDSNGTIRWWNVQNGKCVKMYKGHYGTVQGLRISPDGRLLASCGDDSAIRLWGMENAELQQTLQRERPYERLNITGTMGLTEAQKVSLRALGAIDENEMPSTE